MFFENYLLRTHTVLNVRHLQHKRKKLRGQESRQEETRSRQTRPPASSQNRLQLKEHDMAGLENKKVG